MASVRTDRDKNEVQVIVNDFLCSHLALKGFQWSPARVNVNGIDDSQRKLIGETLGLLGSALIESFESEFSSICGRISVTSSNAYETFVSISDELFCEGIKWGHIVTYLVFGVEFASHNALKGLTLFDDVSQWMSEYIYLHLIDWINGHGGWNGIMQFADETIGQNQRKNHHHFNTKQLFFGAAMAIGVMSFAMFTALKYYG